jgi:hypothetical protein
MIEATKDGFVFGLMELICLTKLQRPVVDRASRPALLLAFAQFSIS